MSTVQEYLSASEEQLQRKNYEKARSVLQQGIAAFKKKGMGDSVEALELQLNVGGTYFFQGQFASALKVFDEVRTRRLAILGISHDHTKMAYQNEAATLLKLDNSSKAIELLQDFAKRDGTLLKPDNEKLVWALDWIKEIQQDQHSYEDALQTNERLRALCLEINPDRSNNRYLTYVLNASAIYAMLGRFTDVTALLTDALSSATTNKDNLETFEKFRLNLASVFEHQNIYGLAISQLEQAIRELDSYQQLGSDTGVEVLLKLASLFEDQQLTASAETLADKSLELMSSGNRLPADNPYFLRAYSVLGSILAMERQDVAALSALEFSYQQHASSIGAIDDDYIKFGYRLLDAYLAFGMTPQAVEFSGKLRKQIGFDPLDVRGGPLAARECAAARAASKLPLALERCKAAAQLIKDQDQTGLDSLRVALELCLTYYQAKNLVEAKSIAANALNANLQSKDSSFQFVPKGLAIAEKALAMLASDGPILPVDADLANTVFGALQAMKHASDEDKVDRIRDLRLSIPDEVVRRRTLRLEYLRSRLERAQLRFFDFSLASEKFKSENQAISEGLQSEIQTVMRETEELKGQGASLPAWRASGTILSIQDVQSHLEETEAAIVYEVFSDQSYVFVISKRSGFVHEVQASKKELGELVAKVRPGEGSTLSQPDSRSSPLEGFDTASASRLYKLLWSPIEKEVSGVATVYVLPDDVLSRLAFPTLLSADVTSGVKSADQIRELPFLLKKNYAISILPDIKSLKEEAYPRGDRPAYFVGVGNPGMGQCSTLKDRLTMDATSDAIDPRTLGCRLSPLPETTSEIKQIGDLFPNGRATVLDGPTASERRFRELNDNGILRKATLIVLATHGLSPGEVQSFTDPMRIATTDNIGIPIIVNPAAIDFARRHTDMPKGEIDKLNGSLMMNFYARDVPDMRFSFPPGLIFSAPDNSPNNGRPDASNDGFLSSSEIAALDIDPDLVVLSACNTAAQEPEGSSAVFSGLTRAFLAAGAKSVIVTQWSVVSEATGKLTPAFFRLLFAEPKVSAPDALRRAMLDVLTQGTDPHPYIWGPFVYVGRAAHL
jgi:CHAT domain-containing protein/tetratricopeptide (TPR) repeat protein